MTDDQYYKTLVKYSLVAEVAAATGLHRNTVKNVLTGRSEESQYLDIVRVAAQLAIDAKEMEIQARINDLQAKLAA